MTRIQLAGVNATVIVAHYVNKKVCAEIASEFLSSLSFDDANCNLDLMQWHWNNCVGLNLSSWWYGASVSPPPLQQEIIPN